MRYYLGVFVLLLSSCGGQKQSPETQNVDSIEAGAEQSLLERNVDRSENYTFGDPQLRKYEQFIAEIDASDVDNVKAGTEKFKLLFHNKSIAVCDSAIYLFLILYDRIDDKINDLHYQDTTNYEALVTAGYDSASIPLSKKLADYGNKLERNGFYVAMTEGTTYIKKDRNYIKENFYSYLSPIMVSYLEQLNLENAEGFWEDGGLVIGPKVLIDRIAWWESFNRSNPDFIFRITPVDLQRIYTNSLITGEDNTPLYFDGELLDEYYKSAYDYLLDKYRDTETAKLLKPYYSSLLKQDTAAIKKFQKNHLKW